MKRKTILKITMLFAFAMFLVNGIFAQPPGAPYTEMVEVTDDATQTDSVTGGISIPYFVMPDPVLNSGFTGDYNEANTASSQSVLSTFDWFETGSLNLNINDSTQGSATGDLAPYIEVQWTAPGAGNPPIDDTLSVQEISSGSSCPGTISQIHVNIFNAPSFEPIIDDDDQIGDPLIEVCEGNGLTNVQIESVGDNDVDAGNLKFRMAIVVDSVDASISTLGDIRANGDTVVSVGTPVDDDANQTDETDVTILSNYWIDVVDGKITRYRFDFSNGLGGGDGTAGISDKISRKSDYLSNPTANDASWTYTAPTDNGDGTLMTYIVYPAPNTGNIYYIPNDFNE